MMAKKNQTLLSEKIRTEKEIQETKFGLIAKDELTQRFAPQGIL